MVIACGTLGLENKNLKGSENRRSLINLLPLDMCKWQVEDGDVEVVHEVLARHHLFFTSRPL